MTLPQSVVDRSDLHRNKTEAQLAADGWQRCFVAEEPRLSESIETYEELGLEVIALPVQPREGECTSCIVQEPGRFLVILTRQKQL